MLSLQQSDYRIKFNINSIYRNIYRKKTKKMNKEELIKLRNSVNYSMRELDLKINESIRKNKEFVNSRRYKLLNKKSKAESHFKNLLINAKIKYVREKTNEINYSLYYTDFFISSLNLNIEIDGKEHLSNIEYDFKKELRIFNSNKSLTLRLTNEEVLSLDKISISFIKNKLYNRYIKSGKKEMIKRYYEWKSELKKQNTIKERIKENKYFKLEESTEILDKLYNSNSLNVFTSGKYNKNKMILNYNISEGKNIIIENNLIVENEIHNSNQKADLMCINKALEYIYFEGGKNENINIISSNSFIISVLKNGYRPNNNISIFADELESFYNISEQFNNIEFYWVPKEINISKK